MNLSHLDSATSVMIVPLGYLARCAEADCRDLGRLILRYADLGGAPLGQAEFCNAHGHSRVAKHRIKGIKIYDDRDLAMHRH
jgi:hypothetical protein